MKWKFLIAILICSAASTIANAQWFNGAEIQSGTVGSNVFNSTVPTYIQYYITNSPISWDKLINTPTTLSQYGITDAVSVSDTNGWEVGSHADFVTNADTNGWNTLEFLDWVLRSDTNGWEVGSHDGLAKTDFSNTFTTSNEFTSIVRIGAANESSAFVFEPSQSRLTLISEDGIVIARLDAGGSFRDSNNRIITTLPSRELYDDDEALSVNWTTRVLYGNWDMMGAHTASNFMTSTGTPGIQYAITTTGLVEITSDGTVTLPDYFTGTNPLAFNITGNVLVDPEGSNLHFHVEFDTDPVFASVDHSATTTVSQVSWEFWDGLKFDTFPSGGIIANHQDADLGTVTYTWTDAPPLRTVYYVRYRSYDGAAWSDWRGRKLDR